MLEKPHVVHILSLLRDALAVQSPTPGVTPRLPSYTTLLLAHALRGVFYPSNFTYPLTAKFLLQRPQLDVTDVPLLYSMLYSSTDDNGQWKKDRAWMLRFLTDGMQGRDDWRVFRRRHTWDLVASLFESDQRDRAMRRGVLEVRQIERVMVPVLICFVASSQSYSHSQCRRVSLIEIRPSLVD
jgi:nucleolar pre-ribosomal-associated protein 1